MIYLTSGLWMKTWASSELSTNAMPETCTGCCRSSLIGLVMNMKFVSLEQTCVKPTNVVSRKEAREMRDKEHVVLQITVETVYGIVT